MLVRLAGGKERDEKCEQGCEGQVFHALTITKKPTDGIRGFISLEQWLRRRPAHQMLLFASFLQLVVFRVFLVRLLLGAAVTLQGVAWLRYQLLPCQRYLVIISKVRQAFQRAYQWP